MMDQTVEPKRAATNECPRCRMPLGTLPRDARFCPKCGQTLTSSLAASASGDGHSLRERLEHIRDTLCRHWGDEPPPPSLENVHSLMLLGYSNAMLHLGW